MSPAEKERIEQQRVFINQLVAAKHKAGALGLWKTMHALDEATRTVGYEVAEKIADVVGGGSRETPA